MKIIAAIIKGVLAYAVLFMMGLTSAMLRLISGNRLGEFNRTVVTPFFCKLGLIAVGINYEIKNQTDCPDEQVLYIFNHNSFLDIFILPLLKLKNTKYIMTESALGIRGIQMSNWGNEALLLPSKDQRERRLNSFKDFANILKQNDFSTFAAPEGQHEFRHGIDWFNRGVIHLATETKLNIVPIYIHIPKENNPLQGYSFKSGSIYMEFLPKVETSEWTVENIDKNKEILRDIYINKFNEAHGIQSI